MTTRATNSKRKSLARQLKRGIVAGLVLSALVAALLIVAGLVYSYQHNATRRAQTDDFRTELQRADSLEGSQLSDFQSFAKPKRFHLGLGGDDELNVIGYPGNGYWLYAVLSKNTLISAFTIDDETRVVDWILRPHDGDVNDTINQAVRDEGWD